MADGPKDKVSKSDSEPSIIDADDLSKGARENRSRFWGRKKKRVKPTKAKAQFTSGRISREDLERMQREIDVLRAAALLNEEDVHRDLTASDPFLEEKLGISGNQTSSHDKIDFTEGSRTQFVDNPEGIEGLENKTRPMPKTPQEDANVTSDFDATLDRDEAIVLLKREHEKSKLNHKEFAERLGIAPKTLRQAYSGKATIDLILDYLGRLGLRVQYRLIRDEDFKKVPPRSEMN